MTTAKDVKTLVRPILERHPQFVLVGRLLFMRPVRHILRGMFIDRCRSKELFDVFCVLDIPLGNLTGFTFGNAPVMFHHTLQWKLTTPDIDLAVLDVFERRILPLVECIPDLKEFEILMLSEEENADFVFGGLQAILVSMALGDLARAAEMAEGSLIQFRSRRYEGLDPYERHEFKRIEDLRAMQLRGDKTEMAEHLHALERQNIENLKLTKFHERTPFPLEMM